MNKVSVLCMVLTGLSTLSFTPIEHTVVSDNTNIEWLSWEEAMKFNKEHPKKILLNVYTDWCGWCKRMDTLTYSDPYIATLISENFYPVKFDAESQKPLEYKGETYEYMKSGKKGYHGLAVELLKGRISYPSVVFLDLEQEVIQSIVGFKTAAELEQILTYFAEDHYLKTPWSVYQRTFEPMLIKD